MAWSPDGKLLASPSKDMTIRLWDAETGELVRTLAGSRAAVFCVAFDPVGRTLASGNESGIIHLWDAGSGRLLRTLEGHKPSVYCVAFDPSGHTLASASIDQSINLWDPSSGELLHTLEDKNSVYWVAFDPKGHTLASGGYAGIKLWDPGSGKLLRTLDEREGLLCISFHPAGHILAGGAYDGSIKLWDPTTGSLLRTIEGHTDGVYALNFNSRGQILVTRSLDNSIRLWSCSDWRPIAQIFELSSGSITAIPFHPVKPVFVATGSEEPSKGNRENADKLLKIYELELKVLLGQAATPAVTYTSAKIVLLGDSGVGKTGLGWRLAHGEFNEHASTHGQQFWPLKQLSQQRRDGVECEAILWDFAGQPDYRLITRCFSTMPTWRSFCLTRPGRMSR
jgi:WD40 repeat protein